MAMYQERVDSFGWPRSCTRASSLKPRASIGARMLPAFFDSVLKQSSRGVLSWGPVGTGRFSGRIRVGCIVRRISAVSTVRGATPLEDKIWGTLYSRPMRMARSAAVMSAPASRVSSRSRMLYASMCARPSSSGPCGAEARASFCRPLIEMLVVDPSGMWMATSWWYCVTPLTAGSLASKRLIKDKTALTSASSSASVGSRSEG